MPVNPSPVGGYAAQFFDNNGEPLSGGKLFTYEAGTSTLLASYTSVDGLTPHTNPIVLDSAGRVPGGQIWLTDGVAYKFVLETAAAVLIGTYDDVQTIAGDAAVINYEPAFTGGVTANYTVSDKFSQTVSVKDFGAVGDGIVDDTAAIQAAIDTNLSVYMPVGEYHVTDLLLLNNGQKLYGEGRTVSMFVVKTDFNMMAAGVVQLGTAESGAEIYDVGFSFQQANQAVRANCTQYPPAIIAPAVPRYIIDRVRIERAWDGISVIGNSGGGYIGFVEIGALNKGVEIDGSLDFTHGQSWHFWPFGIFPGYPSLLTVFYDGDTIAATFGRCDGLAIDELSSFSGQVIFTAATQPQIPAEINTLQLDNDGARLLVQGGRVSIGQSYSTKSANVSVPTVEVTGTGVCILNQHLLSTNLAGPELYANGGTLIVNGGHFTFVNLDHSVCQVDAGFLTLNNIYFEPANNVPFNEPHVKQVAGSLSIMNCEWANRDLGTGTAVHFTTDVVSNKCSKNYFGAWDYVFPAANSNGDYGDNRWISAFAPPNDVVSECFIGTPKYAYLTATSDALGEVTIPHNLGVTAALKVLSASAWYKGPSAEAEKATVDSVDGTNVYVSGAGNTKPVRVIMQWSTTVDPTW